MANGYYSSSTGCVFIRNDNSAVGIAQLRLITLSGRSQIFSVPAGTQLILRDVLRLEELDVGGIALSSLTVLDVPAGTDCAPATVNSKSLPMSKRYRFTSGASFGASSWGKVSLVCSADEVPVVESVSLWNGFSSCASINQISVSRNDSNWYLTFYVATAADNAFFTVVYAVYPAIKD